MDRNKKILIKQQELDENNNLVMAREFVDLDEKVSSIKNDINSKNNQDIVDEIRDTGDKIIEHLPKPEKPTEFPKEIAINNIPDVQNVKVLNFPEQKSPIVNVEAPVVKIETKENKINTENIEKGIRESNLILKDIYKKLEIEDTEVENKEFEKVTLVDEDGKPIKYLGGGGGGVAKYVYNAQGKTINPATEETLQSIADTIKSVNIPAHDYISLSYTGSDLTGVIYKTGGSSGTVVATLTLAYTGGNLTSVTKVLS